MITICLLTRYNQNVQICCVNFKGFFFKMSGGHKHRYKNAGLSADELRRRREEEGVQLRKQKREQQLFKRRNVNLPAPNAPDIALQVITLIL